MIISNQTRQLSIHSPSYPAAATANIMASSVTLTKSSTLATSDCKLEKQFLTAQNMASHYKRVINAKKTIDNNPPKSLTSSQKARDRAKRELLSLKQQQRSSSSFSRPQSADPLASATTPTPRSIKSAAATNNSARQANNDQQQAKPRVLPDQVKLNRSMANLMNEFTNTNRKTNNAIVPIYKPTMISSARSVNSNVAATAAGANDLDQKTKTALNTLLFSTKEPSDANHPALKAMSKLVAGHSYDVLDLHSDKFKNPNKEFVPRIKDVEKSKSNLLGNSSCYQPPRIRRKLTYQTKTTKKRPELKQQQQQQVDEVINNNDDEKLPLKSQPINNINSKRNEIRFSRTMEKEEELKYLEFIKNVTDEIIARDLTSNRAIENCFEKHVRNNRILLNEAKMRELLETLKADISAPYDLQQDIMNQSAMSSSSNKRSVNKALMLDKENGGNNNDSLLLNNDYLTLQKFATTNVATAKTAANRARINNDADNNDESLPLNENNIFLPSSRRASNRSIQSTTKTDSLFDAYENQIAKNIQSIRRNSIDNNNNNSNGNLNQTQSPKPTSRRGSNNSEKITPVNFAEEPKFVNKDDDDDDVFSSEYKPHVLHAPASNTNKSAENMSSSKSPESKHRSTSNSSSAADSAAARTKQPATAPLATTMKPRYIGNDEDDDDDTADDENEDYKEEDDDESADKYGKLLKTRQFFNEEEHHQATMSSSKNTNAKIKVAAAGSAGKSGGNGDDESDNYEVDYEDDYGDYTDDENENKSSETTPRPAARNQSSVHQQQQQQHQNSGRRRVGGGGVYSSDDDADAD